jgi:NADH-quinone oxidoreductase subunit H
MEAAILITYAVKAVLLFAILLVLVMLVIWAERKIIADMQSRIGPNRAGPFGILQTLADGIKLFMKEDVIPTGADRVVFWLAPIISMVPAFLSFSVVPIGDTITVAGRETTAGLADLNVSLLFFLAMGSISVYGIALAGWSSGSKYPLLGAVRSSAQMISYEIAMGLSVVPVVLYAGTLSLREIVEAQSGTWFVAVQFPAFVIFLLAGIAETNRPPFDLPEAETELVAGYHTEYSGVKFAMFFLAEYIHIVTISSIAVTLFLGGWQGPRFAVLPGAWPIVWFTLKVSVFIFVFFWLRASLPRLRYDHLMTVGWKYLIPIALIWIPLTALAQAVETRQWVLYVLGGIVALLVLSLFVPQRRPVEPPADEEATTPAPPEEVSA